MRGSSATDPPLSSRYRGHRLPVLRAIDASERRHPNPKGSLPSLESSVSASEGPPGCSTRGKRQGHAQRSRAGQGIGGKLFAGRPDCATFGQGDERNCQHSCGDKHRDRPRQGAMASDGSPLLCSSEFLGCMDCGESSLGKSSASRESGHYGHILYFFQSARAHHADVP